MYIDRQIDRYMHTCGGSHKSGEGQREKRGVLCVCVHGSGTRVCVHGSGTLTRTSCYT
jgi:hypothetical protein